MITEEEKLIIEEADNKLVLKKIFEDLSSSMIEYYDLNHLTKKELKHDIQEAWMLTLIKAREIDEKVIKENCLNERNEILKNNQNPNPDYSDPAQEEKISALEKEIKELNETIELLEKKTLNAKSENWKLKSENFDLLEKFNATPGASAHNTRGAGRKQKLNNETIEKIKHERKTYGSKLSDLAKKYKISIGLVSKIINN